MVKATLFLVVGQFDCNRPLETWPRDDRLTASDISQSLGVTPAAIAGMIFRVNCTTTLFLPGDLLLGERELPRQRVLQAARCARDKLT